MVIFHTGSNPVLTTKQIPMKTAMQSMLEDLQLKYKILSDAQMIQGCAALESSIEYAESLIIREKEQIIDAYIAGDGDLYFLNEANPEKYYNEAYQDNPETLEEWKAKFTHHCAIKPDQNKSL